MLTSRSLRRPEDAVPERVDAAQDDDTLAVRDDAAAADRERREGRALAPEEDHGAEREEDEGHGAVEAC